MSNSKMPEAGDYIEVGPGDPGYDLKSLKDMGRIKIQEVKHCTLRETCTTSHDRCILMILELPRWAELHDCKICYHPNNTILHKTTDAMRDANTLIIDNSKENYELVTLNGETRKIYKSNKSKEIDISEIEDLIL